MANFQPGTIKNVNPHELPNQQVSNKAKGKATWYIPNANYWIQLAIDSSTKATTKKFLQAANGLIDDSTYSYVLKNYVSVLGERGEMYGTIRDVDFLTSIKERYMGEFINNYENFQVLNNDASIVLARNQALAKKSMAWINQEIINRLNAKGFPTNQVSMTQKDLEKVRQEAEEEFIDKVAINGQKRLNLLNTITNDKEAAMRLYYYWWCCQECYTYRTINNGEVYKEVISPLEYYRIPSGQRYVEDDDGGVRVYQMTIDNVIKKFRDLLTKSEIDYLRNLYNNGDPYDAVQGMEWIRKLDDFAERHTILNTRIEDLNYLNRKSYREIDVYHYQWKTEVKCGILTYQDALGNIAETEVDETYKFDPELGDIDIRWEWVLQVWEGYRFGGMHDGVYTKPTMVPVQREKFDNISDVKLSYNGIVGLINEDLRNPIPYRVQPFMALYRIYTLQQERAAARFKAWLLFPESILGDSNKMTTEERLALANKDGFLPFDDADMEPSALQGIKEIATTAIANYMDMLERLKQGLKQDAYEAANMNSARMGESKDYAGKAVNEMNYQNALISNVWNLEVFNSFREKDYQADLDYSKFAWIEGKQGSYIDPSTGQVVVVDLDGVSDWCDNIGVYIRNSNEVQNKLNQIKEIAFAAAQNGDLDLAIDAVMGNNLIMISRNIKDAIEAKRQLEKEMAGIEQKYQMEVERIVSEREAEKRAYESEQKQLDRDNDLVLKQMEIESNERIWEARLKIDVDGNGYITREEAILKDSGYTESDIRQIEMQKALNK